ncbi:MAG TPA: sigma-54 dependent transcriptional regulator [bacterium]|jgi:two-component system response regulator AtoC|nr:sigma-54 dependent transcriptional regulator [bacterium]
MRVLIIDDEPDLAVVTERLVASWGHEVASEIQGRAGIERQRTWNADLVLLDIGLPDLDGLAVLTEIRRMSPETTVIMLTGQQDPRLAVQAVRQGAEDYLTKPADPEELRLLIEKAAETTRLRRELQELRERSAKGYLFLQDSQMREIYASLSRVAATDRVTVLIQGETGTGKEHAARLLHQLSPRAGKPFQELHCAALPETLLESELFGYEAGAFTDARKAKPGLMEQAQGGTLFLDEIGELPLSMQTKLLKVLEDRQLRRLGGLKALDLDVRLVAATNRDLQAEVMAGRFRADLLYRLKVYTLQLPPLRERPQDVEALARFFHAQFQRENGRRADPLPREIIRALQAYAWPGNIRELKNAMERFCIQQGHQAPAMEHLPAEIRGPQAVAAPLPPAAGAPLPPAQQAALQGLLERHRWNKTKAAAELGVSRPTFLKRLKEAGIE